MTAGEALAGCVLVLILIVVAVKWTIEGLDRGDRKRIERKTEQQLDREAYREWQREVAEGKTSLGYEQWISDGGHAHEDRC
jgi:hypothetical protein